MAGGLSEPMESKVRNKVAPQNEFHIKPPNQTWWPCGDRGGIGLSLAGFSGASCTGAKVLRYSSTLSMCQSVVACSQLAGKAKTVRASHLQHYLF